MFRILVLLFIIIPVIELWGIIAVGKVIGAWPTVAMLILSGIVGAWLAKRQGMQTIQLLKLQLSRGEMPTDTIIDGVLILIGGIFLITPGFFTDLVGLVFLIPFVRMLIRLKVKHWLWSMLRSGRITFFRR